MNIKVTDDYLTIDKQKFMLVGIYYIGIEDNENAPRLKNLVVKSVYGSSVILKSKDRNEINKVYKEISTELTKRTSNFENFITHTINLDKVEEITKDMIDLKMVKLTIKYPEGDINFCVSSMKKAKEIINKIETYQKGKTLLNNIN